MVPASFSSLGPVPYLDSFPFSVLGSAAQGLCCFPGTSLAYQSLWLLLQVEIKAGDGTGPWAQGAAVKVPRVCVCGGG
jgi:hypothetical protein